ncbi:MAG: fibronectin, type III protein, partial [uncultured bacterium]
MNVSSDGLGKLKDLGSGSYHHVNNSLMAWSKLKEIDITNNVASTLTNYQVKVTLTYDADMQADFDDIRFVDTDGTTLLDYWLESKTDSSTATFWVEIPSHAASATEVIYVYYGNAAASSSSSITNTFLFGDDFAGSSVDSSKWSTTTGTSNVSGGLLVLNAGAGLFAGSYAVPSDTIWEASVNHTGGGNGGGAVRAATTTGYGWVSDGGANLVDILMWGSTLYAQTSSGENSFGTIGAGLRRYKITYRPGDVDSVLYNYENGTSTTSRTGSNAGGTLYPTLYSASGDQWDWFFIRKYASTEPTVSVSSTEANIAVYDDIKIIPASGGTHPHFSKLFTFAETLGSSNAGSVKYQIGLDSNRDGTVDGWYYWSGSAWAAVTTDSTDNNPATTINSNIATFHSEIGTGDAYIKAFLISNGSQAVELDAVNITYEPYNTAPSTPSSLGPASYVNGSTVNNYLPTLNFTLSDTDGADTVKYQIQIDDSSDFSSAIVDYTSALAAQGATSFTVGQAAGSGTYTTGSVSTTLSVGTSYYWRVKAIDNSVSASSYATANSGAIAFVVGQPTVTLGVSGSPLAENGGAATVTATLSGSASQDTTVNISYSGTATNTTDYTRSATSITVTAGATTGTVTLTGVNDALDETDETVIVDISGVSNGTESGTQQITATITDDDATPTL